MLYRTAAMCGIILCLAACNKQESFVPVRHPSAWQREAGQSELAAANIARQSSANTARLIKAMQSGKSDDFAAITGKLVSVNGKVDQQNDSSWTIQIDDGWTIVAQVSDPTPRSDISNDLPGVCCAQGIIRQVDSQQKRIMLADVEIAPAVKGPPSEPAISK